MALVMAIAMPSLDNVLSIILLCPGNLKVTSKPTESLIRSSGCSHSSSVTPSDPDPKHPEEVLRRLSFWGNAWLGSLHNQNMFIAGHLLLVRSISKGEERVELPQIHAILGDKSHTNPVK